MTLNPEVLVLGSRYDFSCDYVVAHLARHNVCYLRLNSEDLPLYDLSLDPVQKCLACAFRGTAFVVSAETLRSIWFRRGVYPRDAGPTAPHSVQDQIVRAQWGAFLRGLTIFERAKWINHPAATYLAEQKPLQLALAHEIGFRIPNTIITNHAPAVRTLGTDAVAIKGVDTVIAYEAQNEVFGFTNLVSANQIASEALAGCPVLLQEAITPKTDIRVTVIDNEVFATSIDRAGKGIDGDWRIQKAGLRYLPIALPTKVEQLCLALTHRLGLSFAAIDLVRQGDDYLFLEVNPTGEWSWLVDNANLKIDEAIAHALMGD